VFRCSFCSDQLLGNYGDGFTVWRCRSCDTRYIPGPDVQAFEAHRNAVVGGYLEARLRESGNRRRR